MAMTTSLRQGTQCLTAHPHLSRLYTALENHQPLIILIWAQGKGKKGSKGKGKRSCEDSAFECGILGGEQGKSTLRAKRCDFV